VHACGNDWRGYLYADIYRSTSDGICVGECGGTAVTRGPAIDFSNGGTVIMRKLAVGLLVVCSVVMLGCSPVESKARDTAAALSGAIVAAQTQYQASCVANPNQQVCQLIDRGVAGENALITAVETYCGWTPGVAPTDPTATCVPVKSAQAALETAIANASTLTLEIKGAI
jgi:hypothetical protein